jgi:hypothetical protein
MQIRQETDKGLGEILDAKQKERLDQISLQVEGPLAVARPEIAAKLRLNENQQNTVQEIMMQMRQELFVAMRQGAATGQVNPAQMREMATQLRKEAVNEVSKVIDAKQRAAFNKLLGAKFDTTKLESETASVDPNADPQKPGDVPQAKDAPADGNEPAKEAAKKPAPSTRKKGRTKSGSGSSSNR